MPYKLLAPDLIKNTTIDLSSSKSISNRVLVINYLSGSDEEIQRISTSNDTRVLIEALQLLRTGKGTSINIGHAGTSMRFLTSLLAITEGEWTITGSDRMQERPVAELVDALRELGASISYLGNVGFPPLKIKGSNLNGGKIKMKADISSQFITSLLLIAPYLKSGLTIEFESQPVSFSYLKMTISLLKLFGVRTELNNRSVTVYPGSYKKNIFSVESDWSSASYWYSFISLSKRGTFTLTGLKENSLQGDSVVCDLYKKLGVQTSFTTDGIRISKNDKIIPPDLLEYDFTNCPDIAQTLAVTCSGLKIPFIFSGLQTLNLKESKRIETLASELRKFGIEEIITTENSISIRNYPDRWNDFVSINTFEDHRMAMAFAPFSLLIKELSIEEPEVVKKSYPEFWDHIQSFGVLIL